MTAYIVIVIVFAVICLLYLFLIAPKAAVRTKELLGVHYAHRGLHDNQSIHPENSMNAFKKAIKAGYGIELDVQLTKDWVPVVFHDYTLDRVCGVEGKVYEYTYEELKQFKLGITQESIPRFEDVMKYIGGRVPVIVELKTEGMDMSLCAIVDKVLREYQGVYCIESFNPLAVYWFRRNHPEVIRGQLSDAFSKSDKYKGALYWALEHLLFNCLTKPDFIAYNHKYPRKLSRLLCRKLYRALAVAWTIKSEEELAEARKNFDLFIFDSFQPAE